jgi:hypothetical protein
VAAFAPATALALSSVSYFKTPSGKIVCAWVSESLSFQNDVFCYVTSGLKPAIPKSDSCGKHVEHFESEVGLRATGVVLLASCADVRPIAGAPRAGVLGYGKTLKGGGLVCSEANTGLTCRNRSGHGFFLSPRRWRKF